MEVTVIRLAATATLVVACWAVVAAAQPPATDLIEDPAAVQSDADSTASDPAEDDAGAGFDDLLKLDVEQLGKVDVVIPSMDVEVTSVTRTESTVGRSPAAIFVITPEMIRRSGATCVPEVLRMVPGVEVARINASQWAITARGFNSHFSNKLQVQIDGRSIYSPLFGGVHWESNSVMLQDVERIEVIRGPGATVWGSNAVNGIINIITKPAEKTQGLLVYGGAGTEERGMSGARYGGGNGDNLHWRVYGMQFDRDQGFLPQGTAVDDWRKVQTGFRAEWEPTARDSLTLQGDYYNGTTGLEIPMQLPTPPYGADVAGDAGIAGGNVLARLSRDLGANQGWAFQFYYDRFQRHSIEMFQDIDTIDLDFQYELPLGQRHKLVWGGGYRYYRDRTAGTFTVRMDPAGRDSNLFSYFLQDEITLCKDRLFFTAGSKFEHNTYTDFEYQPTGRLLWTPDPRRAVWGAVSRAVRIPCRTDEDMRNKVFHISMGPPPPVFAQLTGQRGLEAEDLMAYEIGYRAQPTDAFSWDIAVFFNKYENLIVFNPTPIGFPPPAIWSWPAVNGMDGETYGYELTSTVQMNPCWRVTGSYSYLQMQLHADAGVNSRVESVEGRSPHNQVYARSSWDLARDVQFDLTLRYVDSLSTPYGNVPSYVTMDTRLGWRASPNLEVAVVGQNLLDSHHYEFVGFDSTATGVDRGVYAIVTLRR